MANALILRDTWTENATVHDGSGVLAGTAKTNVLNSQPRDKHITAANPYNIELEVSPADTIQGVFVGFVRCSTSATIRIHAKEFDGGATKFDTGTVSFWGATPVVSAAEFANGSFFYQETTPANQTGIGYLQVLITGKPTGGNIEVGRVMAGTLWQPAMNIDYGDALGWVDAGSREQGINGVTFPDRSASAPYARFTMKSSSRSEIQANAMELGRIEGGHKPILYVRDPDDTNGRQQNLVYGPLSSRQLPSENYFSHFVCQYEVHGMT